MAFARFTRSAAVGDSYEPLATLLNLPPGSPTEIVVGDINVQVSGMTYVLVPRGSKPDAAEVGVQYPAGTVRTFDGSGAVAGGGMRLDEMWVKETTGGGGAVVVFSGVTRGD